MAEQDPPSKLWTTISNLSGHTIVAGVLIYITTSTIPGLSQDFRVMLAEQRSDLLQVVAQHRTDFLEALRLERQWNEHQRQALAERQQVLQTALREVKQTLLDVRKFLEDRHRQRTQKGDPHE